MRGLYVFCLPLVWFNRWPYTVIAQRPICRSYVVFTLGATTQSFLYLRRVFQILAPMLWHSSTTTYSCVFKVRLTDMDKTSSYISPSDRYKNTNSGSAVMNLRLRTFDPNPHISHPWWSLWIRVEPLWSATKHFPAVFQPAQLDGRRCVRENRMWRRKELIQSYWTGPQWRLKQENCWALLRLSLTSSYFFEDGNISDIGSMGTKKRAERSDHNWSKTMGYNGVLEPQARNTRTLLEATYICQVLVQNAQRQVIVFGLITIVKVS